MTCGHSVMVSYVFSHFTLRMHVPGNHGQHRRHGHLNPGHYEHEERRRNGLLHHAATVWQNKSRHNVTSITFKRDPVNER